VFSVVIATGISWFLGASFWVNKPRALSAIYATGVTGAVAEGIEGTEEDERVGETEAETIA
jgi:hypothetical protein